MLANFATPERPCINQSFFPDLYESNFSASATVFSQSCRTGRYPFVPFRVPACQDPTPKFPLEHQSARMLLPRSSPLNRVPRPLTMPLTTNEAVGAAVPTNVVQAPENDAAREKKMSDSLLAHSESFAILDAQAITLQYSRKTAQFSMHAIGALSGCRLIALCDQPTQC